MRKFTLLIASLFITIGAMAQVTVNTSAYTVKSINRGYLYYDSNNQGSVTSSSHTNLVNATPTGATNEQFAFLRGSRTTEGQYYMYSIGASQFVTYTGNNGVKLELTDEPACTWVLDASDSYYGIKVPNTDQTYINITNWEAVNGCKVIGTGLDDGNKMTLTEVATGLDLSNAIAKIEELEQEARIVTSINTEKYYTLHCKATDHGGNYIADNGTVISGRNAEGTFFVFEPAESENAYYIKSIKTNKYLNCEATANASVLTSDTPTAWTLGIGGKDNVADYVTFTLGNDLYLNNNGGTNSLKANSHPGGPATGNACSLWQLTEYDEVPAIVTYNYKVGERVIATVAHNVYTGDEYPALGSYYGMTFNSAKPEGQIEGYSEHDIDVTIALPFEYADSYENITAWYKLGIRDDNQGPSYLKYDSLKQYIPTPDTYDENAKENFAWAFVGNPITGFSIVNYAAGETMVLSAPSAPTGDKNAAELARMVVKEGAAGNTAWILKATTHNNAKTGSFYVEHPTATSYAFNRQTYNSENSLCYWDSRDTGSALWTELLPMTDTAELEALVAEAETLLEQITIGDGVGEYSSSYENYAAVYAGIVEYASNIPATATNEEIQEKIETLEAIIASFSLNMPKAGHYYRLKGISGNYIDASSLYDSSTGQMAMTTDGNTAGTIFYLDSDAHFLSYAKGTYVKETREIGNINDAKGVWTITESPRKNGKYALSCTATGGNGTHLHDSEGNRADRCDRNCGERHDFVIEEVKTLPVTVSEANYATFYAPVEVTVPAGNVTAHTVTVNGEWATLSEALTTIPANTGVVLKNAGTANLEIVYGGTAAGVEGNALTGTVAKELLTKENGAYYVLANGENGVGFYDAANGEDTTQFYNAGHKAYLYVAGASQSTSLRFDFGGTTGIEQITENREQSTEIYDLQGRRVSEITEKGIYIVGGKKVLVK